MPVTQVGATGGQSPLDSLKHANQMIGEMSKLFQRQRELEEMKRNQRAQNYQTEIDRWVTVNDNNFRLAVQDNQRKMKHIFMDLDGVDEKTAELWVNDIINMTPSAKLIASESYSRYIESGLGVPSGDGTQPPIPPDQQQEVVPPTGGTPAPTGESIVTEQKPKMVEKQVVVPTKTPLTPDPFKVQGGITLEQQVSSGKVKTPSLTELQPKLESTVLKPLEQQYLAQYGVNQLSDLDTATQQKLAKEMKQRSDEFYKKEYAKSQDTVIKKDVTLDAGAFKEGGTLALDSETIGILNWSSADVLDNTMTGLFKNHPEIKPSKQEFYQDVYSMNRETLRTKGIQTFEDFMDQENLGTVGFLEMPTYSIPGTMVQTQMVEVSGAARRKIIKESQNKQDQIHADIEKRTDDIVEGVKEQVGDLTPEQEKGIRDRAILDQENIDARTKAAIEYDKQRKFFKKYNFYDTEEGKKRAEAVIARFGGIENVKALALGPETVGGMQAVETKEELGGMTVSDWKKMMDAQRDIEQLELDRQKYDLDTQVEAFKMQNEIWQLEMQEKVLKKDMLTTEDKFWLENFQYVAKKEELAAKQSKKDILGPKEMELLMKDPTYKSAREFCMKYHADRLNYTYSTETYKKNLTGLGGIFEGLANWIQGKETPTSEVPIVQTGAQAAIPDDPTEEDTTVGLQYSQSFVPQG